MTRICTVLPAHRRVGKKFAFTFAIIFLLQSKAFPEFEVSLTLPLGLSYISPYAEGSSAESMLQQKPYIIDYANIKDAAGPNVGILMQVGNNFDLKNEVGLTGISLLADIGYYLESSGAMFEVSSGSNRDNYVAENLTIFHALNLGIIPKFHFYFPSLKIPFSVGLGGGVKIPFSGTKYLTMHSGEEIKETISYQDIRKTFEYPFIPYVKLTYDAYFYLSKKVALTFGTYMSYDFGMKYDTEKLNADASSEDFYFYKLNLTEYGYSSLTIGISFGVSFGRPDPRPKKEVL